MTLLSLDEKITFRLMKAEKTKALLQMKRHPERWENIGHYIRCAMVTFNRRLETEWLDAEYQKDRMKRQREALPKKKRVVRS